MTGSSLKIFSLMLVVVFLQLATTAHAKDSLDNVVISQLGDEWLAYNKDYNSYFPVLNEKRKKLFSISHLVDLDKYSSYNLNFTASPGLSLFLNGKVIYKNYQHDIEQVKIKIDTLQRIPGGEKEFLTFYSHNGQLPYQSVYIGVTVPANVIKAPVLQSSILTRELNSTSTIYILTFLLILGTVAVLKNRYPKKFFELFKFSNVLPEPDASIIWDISSIPVILFVIINSFCAALILFVIKQEFDLDSLSFLNIFVDRSVLGILIVSGCFFVIYLFKYIQLKVIGWIFNLKEIVKYQFFELMKVSLKINLFLAVLILIFYSSGYFNFRFDFDYFIYFTLFSLLIVLLRVGYLTFTLSGFRNIYLFSYLCTTEILPLVVIVKLILF